MTTDFKKIPLERRLKEWELCEDCQRPMLGIYPSANPARTCCEECGGNETLYDDISPNPDMGK